MGNPPNPAQERVVGVDVPPEPSGGCEDACAQGKPRDKSKAPFVDAFEPRMATLETAMTATQDTLEGLEERVDALEGEYANFTVAIKTFIQDQANTL